MRIYLPKKLKSGLYIGLDLALRSGYAIIDVNKTIQLIGYGLISTNKQDEITKLIDISTKIDLKTSKIVEKYLKQNKNVTFVLEDCFLKFNPNVLKKLARLEGFILHGLINKYKHPKVSFKIIAPSTAKHLAGGKGNFSKRETVTYINKLLKKRVFEEKDHDRADAIILALAGGIE